MPSSKAPSWTKKEIELLEKVWTSTTPFYTLQEIRERYLPHRTENAIANKASRLKFRRGSTTTTKVGEKRKREEAPNTETPQKKAAKKTPIKIKSPNTNKEKESSKATTTKTTEQIVASSNGNDGNGLGENSPSTNSRLRPPIGTNTSRKGISLPVRTTPVDTNEPRTEAPANQVEENVKSTWKDWLQDPDTILNMKALGMGCFLVFCLRYVVPQLEKTVYS